MTGEDAARATELEAELTSAPDTGTKTLLGAATLGVGGIAVAGILGVVRTKVLALDLEPAGVGLYGQITALLAALSAASGLGLGLGTTRIVVEARARGDHELLRRALSVSIVIPSLVATIVSIALLGFSPLLAPLLLDSHRSGLIAVAALTVPLVALQGPLVHAVQGFKDVAGAQGANVLFATAFTAATAAGAIVAGLDGAVVAIFAGNAVYTAALTLRLRSVAARQGAAPSVREGLQRALLRHPAIRAMLGIGVASLAVGLAGGLSDLAVRTLVLKLDSPAGAGTFQALMLISQQVFGVVVAAITFYSFASITEAKARADEPRVRAIVDDALRLMLLLTLPLMLAIGVLRQDFVSALFSAQFADVVHRLPTLIVGDMLRSSGFILGAALVPLGYTRQWLTVAVGCAALYVVASIPLVAAFSVEGAVVGYVVFWGASLILTALVLYRAIGYRPSRITGTVLAAAAVIAGICFAVPGDQRLLGLVIAALGPLSLLLAGTRRDERAHVIQRLRAIARLV